MLDFAPFRSGEQTLAQIAAPLTQQDLRALTNEMIDAMRAAVAGITDADVTFAPVDPQANDTVAATSAEVDLPWTLGHVIVHTTASSEEAAAHALTLARGLPVEGRSRYEIPWETVHTAAQLLQRLEESRHMRLAMLDAWPDPPHLETTYTPFARAGALNALARFVLGLMHDESHLGQISDVVAQAARQR